MFRGTADFEVVLDFDRWAADLIRGRIWHASQELIPLPHGRLRMRLRLNSLEEIERFVLSWGIHATVVRPKSLVKRIRHIATQLHRRYTPAAPVSGQAKEADRLI